MDTAKPQPSEGNQMARMTLSHGRCMVCESKWCEGNHTMRQIEAELARRAGR